MRAVSAQENSSAFRATSMNGEHDGMLLDEVGDRLDLRSPPWLLAAFLVAEAARAQLPDHADGCADERLMLASVLLLILIVWVLIGGAVLERGGHATPTESVFQSVVRSGRVVRGHVAAPTVYRPRVGEIAARSSRQPSARCEARLSSPRQVGVHHGSSGCRGDPQSSRR
jgi:hypothetical protein